MKNTIQEQWATFESLVLPKDCHHIQRQEMKRAFYSGAQSILTLQLTGIADVSDDAGVAILEGWRQELNMFAHQIATGLA